MLDGYSINQHGVIQQIEPAPISYNTDYILNRYHQYPLSKAMGFLRWGFLIGAIGETPDSICDVGYGSGDFLESANSKNKYGIEINDWPLPPGCQLGNYGSYYDVFTFYDSLEHFESIDFLKDLNCKYLAITVPSCNHPENDEWFRSWKHRRFNEHLWHFNGATLRSQMKEYGYQQITSQPVEDAIRKNGAEPNTITSIFRKL
jgi:hypothetical protein